MKIVIRCSWGKQIRACLHGVGDPGLAGKVSFVLVPRASEPSMNFNIAKMVYWMARMTVRNGISGMTRMT